MINKPPNSSAGELDSEMAAYALVSGAMEVIADWLRGDFDTTLEHLADIVAGLLLAVADISTSLPNPPRAPTVGGCR